MHRRHLLAAAAAVATASARAQAPAPVTTGPRFLAQRMRATTADLASGHAPTLSQPEAVARLIMAAA